MQAAQISMTMGLVRLRDSNFFRALLIFVTRAVDRISQAVMSKLRGFEVRLTNSDRYVLASCVVLYRYSGYGHIAQMTS